MFTPLESQNYICMSGKLLLIYICNFYFLSHLLLIYICNFHWNLTDMHVEECILRFTGHKHLLEWANFAKESLLQNAKN